MALEIAIIGAGMTGLTAAYHLSLKGHKVTVFEEGGQPGGLVSTLVAGNDPLEKFYHHIFTSDSYVIRLAEELGLDDKLEWHEPKNAIFMEGKIHPFTSPLDLMKFSPLSLISRVRTGMLILTSRFIKDYSPLERITAESWLKKKAGNGSYSKIWGPLLESKFDHDSDQISGTWIWNKFKLRGASRGKNISKEQLGYMDGSFQRLVYKLVDSINRNGGAVKLNRRITGFQINEKNKFNLSGDDLDMSFDRVLFTSSPQTLAKIASPLSVNYIDRLLKLRYKSNLCLTLELSESLSPYYWITVAEKDIPFVLVIEHTRLVGKRNYGSHIVYLSRYIDSSDELYCMDDDEITSIFLEGLKKVFPAFREDSVKRTTLSRAQYAQPIVVRDYSSMIPEIKSPVEGFYLASMAQIYPEDRGLNYAIRLGLNAADEILKSV